MAMTTKQVQLLLAFLGYEAAADGIPGPQTAAAVRAFQQEYPGLTVDGEAGEATQEALRKAVGEDWKRPGTENQGGSGDVFWQEIRYFTREEFRCKCGGKYCGGFPAEPQEKLIRAAEEVRDHFGKPVTVSSGVRCEIHNARVGGVANSRHRSGKAVDFTVSGVSADQVLPFVQALEGIRYAYRIGRNYVHMDIE